MYTPEKYFSSAIKNFLLQLEKSGHSKQKSVHNFRVQIKKIKAQINFLDHLRLFSVNTDKLKKQIKPLFRSAGRLRENQLNYKLSKNYDTEIMSVFRSEISAEQQLLKNEFLKKIKSFNTKKTKKLTSKIGRQLRTIKKPVMRIATESHIIDHIQLLKINAKILKTDQQLHDIRTQLKMLLEICVINKKLFDRPLPASFKKLKSIAGEIGNWHDLIVFRSALMEFKKTQNSKRNQHTLQNITDRIKSDCNKKRSAIRMSLIQL